MSTAAESLELPSYRSEAESAIHENGVKALQVLVPIAENNAIVRHFLLGLYDGARFPYNLTRLRGLDPVYTIACMRVLQMDAICSWHEVHQYVDNGCEIFNRWALEASKIEKPKKPRRGAWG